MAVAGESSDQPIGLPDHLRSIIKAGQGHKRIEDADLVQQFVAWIEALEVVRGEPIGGPQCTDLEKRCLLDEDNDDDRSTARGSSGVTLLGVMPTTANPQPPRR